MFVEELHLGTKLKRKPGKIFKKTFCTNMCQHRAVLRKKRYTGEKDFLVALFFNAITRTTSKTLVTQILLS